MNTAVTTCPYCNTVVAAEPLGTRQVCPRCQEAFISRGPDRDGNKAAISPLPASSAQAPPSGTTWSNRRIALTVLAVMLLLAGGTVTFALLTKDWRRDHDPKLPPPDQPSVNKVVAPRDLPLLGFLPRDTNVIAAVHVAEAMDTPGGKEFLTAFHPKDVVDLPNGLDRIDLAAVPRITGVSLEEIAFVAAGADIDAILPKATIVVRTLKPCDREKIKSTLNAKRRDKAGRELWDVTIDNVPGFWLSFVDERTFVIALLTVLPDEVPVKPREGLNHFPPSVRGVLENELGVAAQAWMVGHSDDWAKTVTGQLLMPQLPPETQDLMKNVRTVGVRVTLVQGVTVGGVIDCADRDTAAKLKKSILEKGASKTIPLFGNRQEFAPLTKQLGDSLKVEQNNASLLIQAKASSLPKSP
jgi:hypothetical protein